MSEQVTRMQAVKRFLDDTPNKPQTSEFMTFWKACSESERAEFGESTARQLGLELAAQI
jgi:hypothetical protein